MVTMIHSHHCKLEMIQSNFPLKQSKSQLQLQEKNMCSTPHNVESLDMVRYFFKKSQN